MCLLVLSSCAVQKLGSKQSNLLSTHGLSVTTHENAATALQATRLTCLHGTYLPRIAIPAFVSTPSLLSSRINAGRVSWCANTLRVGGRGLRSDGIALRASESGQSDQNAAEEEAERSEAFCC